MRALIAHTWGRPTVARHRTSKKSGRETRKTTERHLMAALQTTLRVRTLSAATCRTSTAASHAPLVLRDGIAHGRLADPHHQVRQ